MDLVRQHFYEVSLEYVFKVQEVQERKMFEFVEPVSTCPAWMLALRPRLHLALPLPRGRRRAPGWDGKAESPGALSFSATPASPSSLSSTATAGAAEQSAEAASSRCLLLRGLLFALGVGGQQGGTGSSL